MVYSTRSWSRYLKGGPSRLSHEHPVLIDKYVEGKEIEGWTPWLTERTC